MDNAKLKIVNETNQKQVVKPPLEMPINYVDTEALYSNINGLGVKSICITSSLASEGVSTISYSLARRAAASGKSVLLIDFNIRKPSIAKNLGITSNVWEEGVQLENYIQQLHGVSMAVLGLSDAMIAPIFLRDIHFLTDTIKRLEQEYDLIVVDTPPMCNVDSLGIPAENIARACQGTLITLLAAKTPQEYVKHSLEKLEQQQSPVIGVVVNQQHQHRLLAEMLESFHEVTSRKGLGWLKHILQPLLNRVEQLEHAL